MTFNPAMKMPIDNIAPTENDITFRKRQVQGYVHDPGAAMFGGVAGHAGLFGKANDLAVMMQMMLNEGSYGISQTLRLEVEDQQVTWLQNQLLDILDSLELVYGLILKMILFMYFFPIVFIPMLRIRNY